MDNKFDLMFLQHLSNVIIYANLLFVCLRARKYGWPNTYVFTKALGEMVLGHMRGDVPLVIIRPTIITSLYKEPLSGWMEGIRYLSCCSHLLFKKSYWFLKQTNKQYFFFSLIASTTEFYMQQ